MRSNHTGLFWTWMLVPLVNGAALGQVAGTSRTLAGVVAAAPVITILAAPTGALLRSEGPANASIDLGAVSYFKGTSAVGETSQKNQSAFVVSTRFALRVDCPGNASSQVTLTVSRLDASATHGIAVDGIALGPGAQILAASMPCGSSGDHRLDVEVPVSTPAGPIGSTIAFTATLKP